MSGPNVATAGQPFGDLLRRHRLARALTQEGLAERAGVSARAISDLERGARTFPHRETAILLADALQLEGRDRDTFLAAARRRPSLESHGEQPRREARLPHPLSRLIGRMAEREEITRLLREERTRLLTLTGPAGVGKTRLAVDVAQSLADTFRDGVVFVDLAPMVEPDHVLPAITMALGLSDQGTIPLDEVLRRRLSPQQLLLVLDNFEHLLAAAPLVSALLQAAPAVQALVTSRAPLRLQGEREIAVFPLRTPDPGTTVSADTLDAWAALQLFVERAQDAQAAFRLTTSNAAVVAAICQRLDGLPLAIELAAAWIKVLPPDVLLIRLDQALPLLTAGRRDAPARQRTLEAAITWSYDLLEPQQQALLRALAVFVGGWTLEAAEMLSARCGVCGVLDALAGLVEHNLVVREDAGPGPRYHLLETIRQFACEQLVVSGEEEHVHRAHLHYLLHLARVNDLERLDVGVGTRLARLQAEEANLRAGLAWGITHDPEMALVILAELDFYWFLSDRLMAGRDLHERALQRATGTNQAAQVRVLQQAAWLADYVGDFQAAAPLANAARRLAEQLGDGRTAAHAQMSQGSVAHSRGNIDQARAAYATALTQFASLGDLWGLLMALTSRGVAELEWGDALAAARDLEQVRDICATQDLPDHYHAHYLGNLAVIYSHVGRHDDAMAACVAALRFGEDDRRRSTTAINRLTLVRLLLDRGETAQAISHHTEIGKGLATLWALGDHWNLVGALEVAAALMAAGYQAEPAARALGAATALREAMPYPVGSVDRDRLGGLVAELTAALGEPAFTQEHSLGQRQPLETVIAETRGVLATFTGCRSRTRQ